MSADPAASNAVWSRLIIAELGRCGVDYAVVAPGSRSTPLVMALADAEGTDCTVCHDERGAAFHALGYGRATGRPAAVVCTSGTAVANMLPAVVEAAADGQPLLMVTADRPWELQDAGANQTIDQRDIFGRFASWSVQVPAPDPRVEPTVLLSTIDQAVYRCRAPIPGPVHVNVQFREPLEAEDDTGAGFPRWDYSERRHPLTTYFDHGGATLGDLGEIIRALQETASGLVVAGRGATNGKRALAPAITDLSDTLGWPLLGDAASGVAGTPGLQLLLNTSAGRTLIEADTVLLFGAAPTAKGFLQLVTDHPPVTYVQVEASTNRLDPSHLLSHRIVAPPAKLAEKLLHRLAQTDMASGAPAAGSAAASSPVIAAAAIAREAATATLPRHQLSEPLVARMAASMTQRPLGLFVASSMPIRDVDSFATPLAVDLPVAANRGASGIDGSVATALGFATGLQAPVVALLGDTAAIHDLSSLAQLANAAYGIILVVVNNQGGGIFSMLPIAAQANAATFERYFGASHRVAFAEIAAAFSLAYEHPETSCGLDAALASAYTRATTGDSTLIEVRTERVANAALHTAVDNAVVAAIG